MKQGKYKTAKIKGYIDLTKPSILLMVLITTLLGYYLGSDGISSWLKLFWTLLGTGLSAGGAGALNQYLEREQDCLMKRTRDRPIPAGLIQPQDALLFGLILVLTGSVLLVWKVNLLTGFLSLLTAFMYILIYTPMKKGRILVIVNVDPNLICCGRSCDAKQSAQSSTYKGFAYKEMVFR